MRKETAMTDDRLSSTLRARIYDAFPVTQLCFLRLLGLLDIEATDAVPTAAVTLGGRSRLQINPGFVAQHCATDLDLVMLVLHELHHVALGHTRLFPRVTKAQNWAFDCVINAQLCRLFPKPQWTRLFRSCYSAERFPEALLRPPEGWRMLDERWLPGRAGEVHRALYSDLAVSYRDLYDLLPQLMAEGDAGFDGLLGNHEPEQAEGIAPDVLRELRGILAEWPMVESRSGRDQGGPRHRETVARTEARRQAVAQIRRALLAMANVGECGAQGNAVWQPSPSLLPYAPRLARSDFVRAALGSPALLHEAAVPIRRPLAQERTHVYLDVSGSMSGELPLLYAALQPLSALLHPRVHLFSTEIADIDLSQLARGVRIGTGGTDIGPVTAHALKHRVRRAVIVTDGWVGDVPQEHARALAERRCRFAALISGRGDPSFVKRLACRVWRLPEMENAS
jgi:hypothetical protein